VDGKESRTVTTA
jgi:hypothetical protein